MPRDSTATKEALLREGGRMLARHGLYQVKARDIVQAAGQRNVSAVTYHFGSREGLIDAILVRYGDPTDEARGHILARIGTDASVRELIAALVIPYGAHLRTADGRDYLRIVAQMTGLFGSWKVDRPGTGPWLREILGLLEARPTHLSLVVRQERVVNMILLMTVATAERARAIEDNDPLALDEALFLANLTEVLAGGLEAPLRALALVPADGTSTPLTPGTADG